LDTRIELFLIRKIYINFIPGEKLEDYFLSAEKQLSQEDML